MSLTTIQWTQRRRPNGTWMPGYTLNPWWGCERVSPACDSCYAEAWAKRTGYAVWGARAPRRFLQPWVKALAWNRAAERAGENHLVFCSSMADIFEHHPDPATMQEMDRSRGRLWELIEETRSLTYLLLTKRPQNIRRMRPERWRRIWPPNVWLGFTAEDEQHFKRRWPAVRDEQAKIRFCSFEPALGPLHLFSLRGDLVVPDWVIIGGESGPRARALPIPRVRNTVEFCRDIGAAPFVKQLGSRPVDGDGQPLKFVDRAGGDPSEWPLALRVREFPSSNTVKLTIKEAES